MRISRLSLLPLAALRRVDNSPQIDGVRAVLQNRVVADLFFTVGSRVAQMGLALLGSVLSARTLGPVDFGRFGLVIASVTICGTLADAGLTYTSVKLISEHADTDRPKALGVARTYFALRLISGALVALAGFLLAEPIARSILGQADLTTYLQLAFATLLSLSISSYPGMVLVGLERFGRLGLVGVLNALITVSGILLLFLMGNLTLETLIAWNVVLPLVSTLPAWLMLPREWLPFKLHDGPYSRLELTRTMLGFSKWMAIAGVGTIVAGQLDLIILGRLSDAALVGVYSVALTLALRLDIVNQSLITVMLPRAGRLRNRQEVRHYTKRTLLISLMLALFLGGVVLIAQPVITFLYGERYVASAGLFMALVVVVLFDLVTSSLFLLALPLNRPRVLAVGDWLRAGIMGSSAWLLIPVYGGYGAVAARFIARVLGAVYTLLALRGSGNEEGRKTEDDGLSQPLHFQ